VRQQISATQEEVLVARQPIFDRCQKVVAYELLYRSSRENRFRDSDSATATSSVVANVLLSFGLDQLIQDRKAFINFDAATLSENLATVLPPERVVIEILETVEETENLLRVCEELGEKGYRLALDDFDGESGYDRLLELADIIKVDFRLADPSDWDRIAQRFLPRGIQMLAEKVETPEQYERARSQGYELFQGYFFSRPRIVAIKDIPASKLHHLRILDEIHRPVMDFERIEKILKSDLSMVHKLLRYVNSVNFGLRSEIESVRHALALLGEAEIRKWASLVTLTVLAMNKPEELVVASIVRGRVCERLSQLAGLGHRTGEMFFLGMFSLIDAMLDRPMAEVLEGIHLTDDVRATLIGASAAPTRLRSVLGLAAALERADFPEVESCARELGRDFATVREVYVESVEWAERLF